MSPGEKETRLEGTPDEAFAWPRIPGLPQSRPHPPPRRLVYLGLFLATVATTIIAGACLAIGGYFPDNLLALYHEPRFLLTGIPFSFTLIIILLSHEMGHYLVSRRHQLDVSWPLFIPAPPPFIIGTFGAFIRIRSPIQDKRALLDVGCAGPLLGVLVSIPVILLGLSLSQVTMMLSRPRGMMLGDSLLFQFLVWLVFGSLSPEHQVLLHPVAFAGWIGLFITALNLIPVGQLDGGHVAYALFPDYHRYISLACLGLLLVLGVFWWPGWLMWAVLLAFLGVRHPAPYQYWIPLDGRRRLLGIITILVFLLTFTPAPFSLEW